MMQDAQNINDLNIVCQTMLDNADMDVEFINYPFSIRLTFFVVGTNQKVIFDCSEIVSFEFTKEPEDEPYYLVMEVNVKAPVSEQPFWQINIEPVAQIRLTARTFAWRVETVSREEFDQRGFCTGD